MERISCDSGNKRSNHRLMLEVEQARWVLWGGGGWKMEKG